MIERSFDTNDDILLYFRPMYHYMTGTMFSKKLPNKRLSSLCI